MGKIYDDWGKLVEAVLRRDKLREIAMCHSRESSIVSDGSSRFSFSSTLLFSEQFVGYDFESETALQFDPESLAFYEASPSFSDVPNSEKSELFIMKAKMCCVVFDFSDPIKNLEEKEIKRQTLLELVDYVTSSNVKFTETVMKAAVKMVSVNIFRDFTPPQRKNNNLVCLEEEKFPMMESAWPLWQRKNNVAVVSDEEDGDLEDSDLEEDDQQVPDPAWPHLQIVYELLLRLVDSPVTDAKVAKTYIDRSFITKLLNLFNSEDPEEREFLKIILHRIYGKFMVHRPFIRKAITDIFYHFVHETGKHNGVAEFLEFLGSVIKGFILPLKEKHKISLQRVLIPLHKPKCLVTYHAQLSYCLVEFVKKDCELACLVIEGLIKYWPVTNSSKEHLFLGELEEVLEVTHETEFKHFIVPVFNKVSRCLSSSHSRVTERAALFCLKNEDTVKLIKQNCETILPIILPALERSARDHWDPHVCELIMELRDFFYDLDPCLFSACQIKFRDDESKEHEIKERREVTWKFLEEHATEKLYETCQGASSSFTLEDPPICPRDTNILPKLQQMSKLESRHTDLKFEIDYSQAANKVVERKLVRSKSDSILPKLRQMSKLESRFIDLKFEIDYSQAAKKVVERKLVRSKSDSILPKLQQMSKLESRHTDLKFEIDYSQAAKKAVERKLVRSKSDSHVLQRTNNELQTSNEVIEKELERRKLEIIDLLRTNNELHRSNEVIEKELERRKKEIHDMRGTNNELHTLNKVIDKELERSRIMLHVVLFAVMFYLLSTSCCRIAISFRTGKLE